MVLKRLQNDVEGRSGKPPIDRWDPPYSGAMDLCIAADGQWYHEGSPIRRPALVKLFASILRREGDGHYYLVSPREKWRITVEDTPLRVVAADYHGEDLVATLDTGEKVVVGAGHPLVLRAAPGGGEETPCLQLWHGLDARLARPVYYRLAEWAEAVRQGDEIRWLIPSGEGRYPLGQGLASGLEDEAGG